MSGLGEPQEQSCKELTLPSCGNLQKQNCTFLYPRNRTNQHRQHKDRGLKGRWTMDMIQSCRFRRGFTSCRKEHQMLLTWNTLPERQCRYRRPVYSIISLLYFPPNSKQNGIFTEAADGRHSVINPSFLLRHLTLSRPLSPSQCLNPQCPSPPAHPFRWHGDTSSPQAGSPASLPLSTL